uniref:Uncharacterized protein n=1 Tax=Picea glauca TaxID=3330 RepID=A0A101M157_PICGL|nr:hypothetical protein ABT39_MTgene4340 [Picea glauca]QHR88467.1 hypothetical protein Q903MT_gene2481 [Picea sitchensis]
MGIYACEKKRYCNLLKRYLRLRKEWDHNADNTPHKRQHIAKPMQRIITLQDDTRNKNGRSS